MEKTCPYSKENPIKNKRKTYLFRKFEVTQNMKIRLGSFWLSDPELINIQMLKNCSKQSRFEELNFS